MKKQHLYATILCLTLASTQAVADEPAWRTSLGVKVLFSTWSGDTHPNGNNFEADGNQLRFDLRLAKERFYTGLSIQGGAFNFTEDAPDRVTGTQRMASTDERIVRGEADLIFGYYFWDRVSLFLDLKSIGTDWEDRDYELESGGLGIGANGFVPVKDNWLFIWSVGWFKLDTELNNKKIGETTGNGAELGFLYQIQPNMSATVSLKGHRDEIDFDQGAKQEHNIGGLAFGINFNF